MSLYSSIEYRLFRTLFRHKSVNEILSAKWFQRAEEPGPRLLLRLNLLRLLRERDDLANALFVAQECIDLVRSDRLKAELRLEGMQAVAAAFEWSDQWDSSLPWREELWSLASSICGARSESTIDAMALTATALRETGSFSRAVELHRKALDYWMTLGHGSPERVKRAREQLGISLQTAGDHTEAKSVLSEASRGSAGSDARDAVIFEWLAASLVDLEEFQAAVDAMSSAYWKTESAYGDRHELTLQARENLAMTYWNAGEFPSAIELLEENLHIVEQSRGADDPRVIASKASLARLRRERNG